MNRSDLQKKLCEQLCSNVQLMEREDGTLMISTPFSYPDGDHYSIYLKEISTGKIRIGDGANTMMRLSYDTPDVSQYFKGGRGQLMQQILRENRVKEDDGNFYIDIPISGISEGIFQLGQALSQIYDLSYLNRDSSTSTFYEDLKELLNQLSEKHSIELKSDYEVPHVEKAENYAVDYSLQRGEQDLLFLFGVPNADKAKLATITLQHLLLNQCKIPTLLIFENQTNIPPLHLSRLVDANVGGSQVSSIGSVEAVDQNIRAYTAVH